MKNIKQILILLLLSAMITGVTKAGDLSDEEGIKRAIGYYFQAHATGNGDYLREAFHPVAMLFFVRDNELAQFTLEEYIALFDGNAPADEEGRVRTIDHIEISGNAAVATITLDYPNAYYTDYMSMLKIDGVWKIVNKTFYMIAR